MTVRFWDYESILYPIIDKKSVLGEKSLREKVDLGEGHKVEVNISKNDGTPLKLHENVGSKTINFSANFWSGNQPWFRIDTAHGFLHSHLESGDRPFRDHMKLPSNISVSGLLSMAFDEAEKIIKWKFPNNKVKNGNGFVGFV